MSDFDTVAPFYGQHQVHSLELVSVNKAKNDVLETEVHYWKMKD